MNDDQMQEVMDQVAKHVETHLLAILKRSFTRFKQFAPNDKQRRALRYRIAGVLCTITDNLLSEKGDDAKNK
jgi:hypothetical protein